MSALCRIALLGEFSVQQDQRRITRFRTQKAGALLAFLAYHPDRAHPREHLIELLWPNLEPSSGRANLSFALSTLRYQLEPPGVLSGAVLIADRNSVRINPASITTDAADFEAGLQAVEVLADEVQHVQRLEETLALYRGPLLPGYYEEWVAPERQRLADRYVNAARQLVRGLAKTGELGRAIDQAQRAIGIDPLREALHGDLMRLYVALGQVPMALQQYSVLERTLQQDLGEKPAAATRELVREIRSRQQQAEACLLPYPEERAATTTAQETDSLSAEAADLVLARRASTTTTVPRRGAEEPTLAPSGTATLLLAQWKPLPDAPERSAEDAAPAGEAKADVAESRAKPTAQEGGANTAHQAQAGLAARLRRELGRHGGHTFQRSRQGQGVAFQSVGEALTCAIAVQRNLSVGSEANEFGAFGLCMALHTGDIEPGAQGLKGRVLEQTRRLLEAGHAGQILCSEATSTLLRRDLQVGERLLDLGLFRLRDVPVPEHIFEVEYPGKVPKTCFPLRAEAGYTPHLPLPLTRFFGREELLAGLQSLLLAETMRLVSLTGTGGMGKTRLAIEAARRLLEAFAGSVWFVPLADVSVGTGLLSALVDALGISRSNSVEPLDQVSERLSRQRSLLVLDNFEHLVEAEAATVGLLLERAPTLKCLVTSRQRLELGGEQELAVPPLPVPSVKDEGGRMKDEEMPVRSSFILHPSSLLSVPSVALFVDRAQAVKPDFQITAGNAQAIATLCTRLEGIPLAVELAASRAQVLTPSQMLSQLQNRFDFLASRRRDVTQRHRTLRAALDWSHDLLSPEVQEFFCRLSVFRGGWRLEAAEAVCREDLALDYLAQLRECSMILTEEDGEQVRYRMLETLREYAHEQMSDEEGWALRQRHLEYYLALAEEAEPHLSGSAQSEWLQRLEAEHENLRAGLHWILNNPKEENSAITPSSFLPHPSEAAALRLCVALARFWWTRGHLSEGRDWCVRALGTEGGQRRSLQRAKTLHGVASLARMQGDCAAARAYQEESLGICREIGDRSGIASSFHGLGNIAVKLGDYSAARVLYEQSMSITREAGDKQAFSSSLMALGLAAAEQGDYSAARALYEESLVIKRELGDKHTISLALNNLGNVAADQGDYAAARSLYEESLTIKRELGDKQGIANALTNIGAMAIDQGDYAAARSLMEESLEIIRELGNTASISRLLFNLGSVAYALADYSAARRLYEESLAIRRKLEKQIAVASALIGLGQVTARQGDYVAARLLYEEGLTIKRKFGDRQGIANALTSLGNAACATGDYAPAACLLKESLSIQRTLGAKKDIASTLNAFTVLYCSKKQHGRAMRISGAVEALREEIGSPLPPNERAEYDCIIASMRAQASVNVFAAAWAEGRAMTWEQAVDYVLEEDSVPDAVME